MVQVVNAVTGTATLFVASAYQPLLLVGLWRCGDKAAVVPAVVVACGAAAAAEAVTTDITDMIQEHGVAAPRNRCVTVCVCVAVVHQALRAIQDNLVESLIVQTVLVCVLAVDTKVTTAATMAAHLIT
jgi:hypothetical protein